jgi:two-component system NtrC family sensor kinase
LVEQVVKFVSRSIDADGVLVAVADGEKPPLDVSAAHGCLASLEGSQVREDDSGLIIDAMGAEHMQVAHGEDGQLPQLVPGVEARTAAVAPLRAHGVTVGVLATVRNEPTPFSSTDLRQLSTVAAHAAIVLENARLFGLVTSGKHQWEATFDALSDGVAVLDGDNRIVRANRSLAQMIGKPIPAVVNADMLSTLTGDLPAVRRYLANARSGKADATLTVQSAPVHRTLRTSAAPMPGAGEGWLVVLVEDVTERRAMEAHLIQSEKMAAVGQLVSGVAHELNNPLSSIAGVSDLLLSKESTPESERPHLQLIHEQAGRASRIVRDLLTFARKGPAGTATVNLNDITSGALSLVQHDLRLRQIDLVPDLCEPPPTVTGDRHELQQVVLNLVTNAIQAVAENPTGRARVIRVATWRRDKQAVLTVADSGPGIPEELLSQIFLPFFTTKGPGEGTGLGLSITYRLIESHHGSISAQAGPDGGTEFTVALPLSAPIDPLHESVPPDYPPESQTQSSAATGRILVVDEDAAVRHSVTVLLTEAGHNVSEVAAGTPALEMLRSRTFDVVVVEPEIMSGDTGITEAILREWPDLRDNLLLITADVRRETEDLLRATGCRLLHKPVGAQELRSAVLQLLGG